MAPKESSLHPRSMLDSMNALKDKEQFCDIVVMAGKDEIKAHKFVLIAASEYFQAMFSSDTRESKTGIVTFPDTPGDVVKRCIDFIYSGKVEFSLDRITDFLKASDIFRLHNLTDLYIEFLSENITIENVADMLSVAQVYQKDLLKTSIQIFFRENLKAFAESQELKSLPKDKFLYMLSHAENLDEEYEMLKWNAIVTWVKDEIRERKDSFVDLFDTMDFSFLSHKFIKDHVIREQLVSESTELIFKICSTLLDGKPSKLPMVPTEKATGIIACNRKSGFVYRYCLIQEKWSAITQIPRGIDTKLIDVAEYKGIIFVTTGSEIISFNGMEWKKLYKGKSYMPYNRCIGCGKYVSMVTSDRAVLYEIDVGKLSSIEIKREDSYLWDNFDVASTQECIYVIGGKHTANRVFVAYEMNLTTMQCSRISDVPINIGGSLGCIFGFKETVFALGRYRYSFRSQDEVVFYNDIEKIWRSVCLPIKYIDGCKVHIADKLYLYGGELGTEIQTVGLEKLMVTERLAQPDVDNVDMSVFCISFLK